MTKKRDQTGLTRSGDNPLLKQLALESVSPESEDTSESPDPARAREHVISLFRSALEALAHDSTINIKSVVKKLFVDQDRGPLPPRAENHQADLDLDLDPIDTAVIPEIIPQPCDLYKWHEPERGCPNVVLRSALFAAIQSRARQILTGPGNRGVGIASQAGGVIEYEGEQLDQFDKDVWLQTLHIARTQPLGTICYFEAASFLRAIGRKDDGRAREDLTRSLDRLTEGTVRITEGRGVFVGHLVSWYRRDTTTHQYKVSFADKIVELFEYWTPLQWEERRKLAEEKGGGALALWLHGYYSSHARPYPVKVETLQKLCGSRTKNPKHFKANLKKSLRLLEKVANIKWQIDGDLVAVERIPSASQTKYLTAR